MRPYGRPHRRIRQALLEALIDGQPCPLCQRPMYRAQALDLDHAMPLAYGGAIDGPVRLSHSRCNRRAGGRIGAKRMRAKRRPIGRPRNRW